MLDSMGSTSYRPHPVLARALDVLFTLHAEHEMNCSTAAVRHLASSGVDVYTAVAGGEMLSLMHGLDAFQLTMTHRSARQLTAHVHGCGWPGCGYTLVVHVRGVSCASAAGACVL